MRVVIAGHVDHGKSTLIGRLLYDSGSLPASRLTEMQAMAEEYKKKFEFSSFLDAFSDEIKEDRTIDTTETFFKGEYLHTLIDVPGHLEFIEAMLTGASHADAAIVVVDVTKGVEEQTRRHLRLLEFLGIQRVLVAVNKMDLVNYDTRSWKIFAVIHPFRPNGIVPISAKEGDNIYTASGRYGEGYGSLVDELDLWEQNKTKEVTPKRFIVQGQYNDRVLGTGYAEVGRRVKFQPSGLEFTVGDLSTEGQLVLSGIGELPGRGEVGFIASCPQPASKMWVNLFILSSSVKVGSKFEFRCGTAKVNCRVTFISRRINSETGESMSGSTLRKYDLGVAVLTVDPVVAQEFRKDPELGRFTLSNRGKNVAIGTVLNYE